MKKIIYVMGVFMLLFSVVTNAQEEEVDHSYKPLKLSLNESGSKYVRFILWHQQWLQTTNLEAKDAKTQLNFQARRSRILAFAQVSPRFLILTHFGLNGQNAGNLTPLGSSAANTNGTVGQFFLHGAWTEFKVSTNKALFIGSGLHYWKGLTRLANASTLNFMTMDQARPFAQWHSLGGTDQFARHYGIYAKGEIGKFDYRIAVNNPLNPKNSLGQGVNFAGKWKDPDEVLIPGTTVSDLEYNGSNNLKNGDPVGNTIIEGYFRVNLLDKESTKLPYQVGTYHGKKSVLGIGAGFYRHGNAMYNATTGKHSNVMHLAMDVFYDAPLGSGGNAINAYASFINFDYGENYMNRWAGTGTNLYGQLGYFVKDLKIMPYVSYQNGNYDAIADPITSFNAGVNYYVNGHNAKITLEYHSIRNDYRESAGTEGDVTQWRLQTHIFL